MEDALINKKALYAIVAQQEQQAMQQLQKNFKNANSKQFQRWSTILTERSNFKNNIINAPNVNTWTPIKQHKPPESHHILVTLKHAEDDYEVCELDYGVDKACGGQLWKKVIAWQQMPIEYRQP